MKAINLINIHGIRVKVGILTDICGKIIKKKLTKESRNISTLPKSRKIYRIFVSVYEFSWFHTWLKQHTTAYWMKWKIVVTHNSFLRSCPRKSNQFFIILKFECYCKHVICHRTVNPHISNTKWQFFLICLSTHSTFFQTSHSDVSPLFGILLFICWMDASR